MPSEKEQINYLELKEFLARNPCVKSRTFTRWKKLGQIDFIQPGGPGTLIFVPEDALARKEQRALKDCKSLDSVNNENLNKKTKSVRKPNWQKRITPTRKDNNAQKK